MRIRILGGLFMAAAMLGPLRAGAEKASAPGTLTLAIAVSDSDAFIDEWVASPYHHAMTIHRIHETGPGKMLYAAFIISGQVPGTDGRNRVDVDITIRRPDGTIDHSEESYAHLSGRQCVARGFAMADPAVTYEFEVTDPRGAWRFEAVAHDRVTGAQVAAAYVVTLHD